MICSSVRPDGLLRWSRKAFFSASAAACAFIAADALAASDSAIFFCRSLAVSNLLMAPLLCEEQSSVFLIHELATLERRGVIIVPLVRPLGQLDLVLLDPLVGDLGQ